MSVPPIQKIFKINMNDINIVFEKSCLFMFIFFQMNPTNIKNIFRFVFT